jgi:hypothetical protein
MSKIIPGLVAQQPVVIYARACGFSALGLWGYALASPYRLT